MTDAAGTTGEAAETPGIRRTSSPGLSGARYCIGVAFVIVLASVVSFTALGFETLDGHEALVVQTSREMSERGDWIVPYISGHLRLNKPPLNYWLTGLARWVCGDADFLPVHGRIPSAIAAVIMVALTIGIGRRLYGRTTGLLAGLLMCGTIGLSHYSHNARPDMLYAMLCTAQIWLFIVAWRARRAPGKRFATAYGMWLMVALATLSKGPHFPLILIGTFALILWRRRVGWGVAYKILRPIDGLILAAAASGWWWVLLRARIGAQELANSQLAGKRFMLGISQLSLYYLVSSWELVLPWVIFWPGAVWLMFQRNGRGAAARALGIMIGVTLIAISFGGEKRWHYMLPLLGPGCVLMAAAARQMLTQAAAKRGLMRNWIALGYGLGAAAGLVGVGIYGRLPIEEQRGDLFLAAAVTLIVTGVACVILNRIRHGLAQARAQLAVAAIAIGIFYIATEWTRAISSHPDDPEVTIARQLSRLPDHIAILAYNADAGILTYYCNRPVRDVAKLADIAKDADLGHAAVVMPWNDAVKYNPDSVPGPPPSKREGERLVVIWPELKAEPKSELKR